MPLSSTSIKLNPDEHIKKHGLSIGDSERWKVEATDQEVRVKPLEPLGASVMTTDLDIATDNKRNYLLVLRSQANYSPAVSWYYPDDVRTQLAVYQAALKARSEEPAQ
ncbi:MAG: TrbG/VirB9 family P-type conjugative transfer protein [Deltaproteobacteria bacterium]|nr:TrbG/VirB9 family P-type conjugative transfer protein [Deltaproteobacteria bacterium]